MSLLQNLFNSIVQQPIFFFSVAPDKVTIEGPKEAKVNDSLHFKCETANSNPPASVQWVVDGRSAHTTSTHSVSKFCTMATFS